MLHSSTELTMVLQGSSQWSLKATLNANRPALTGYGRVMEAWRRNLYGNEIHNLATGSIFPVPPFPAFLDD